MKTYRLILLTFLCLLPALSMQAELSLDCRAMLRAGAIMPDGKVDVKKAKPITFDPFNNTYVVLGEAVGRAFHDGLALK